jgi:adenine-specific DNA-methyltransferase
MTLYNQVLPLTPDLNQERVEILKKLMPDIFTNEGKLNIDELRKIIEADKVAEAERYEFRWFGKTQAKRTAFTPSNATLVYEQKRSFNPQPETGKLSPHLIIEGENLEILKILLAGYREKIKCIYIDPPYNTGKDFVYSDNYTEDRKPYWEQTGVTENGIKIDTNTETDGRYHSNWLNMMYSRLLIARQLLKPDGIIFISIDDNELSNLIKLMDEVFGEESFVEIFSWVKTYTPPGLADKSRKTTEYIVCYEKNLSNNKFRGELLDGGDQPLLNTGNTKRTLIFPKEKLFFKLENGKYLSNQYDRVFLKKDINIKEGFADINVELEGEFKWTQSTLNEEIDNGTTFIIKSDLFAIRFIRDEKCGYKAPTNLIKDKYISNVINKKDNEVGTNESGSSEFQELMGGKYFDFPKPISLIKHVVNFCTSDSDLILDFFGGSGTTGQAVMELNAEDGGNRRFILVQIPEATDAGSEAYKAGYKKISDITIERCRRAAQKIIAERQSKLPELFDNADTQSDGSELGFRVFTVMKNLHKLIHLLFSSCFVVPPQSKLPVG